MHLGLDIGTSAVKAVLVDEDQAVRAEASAPLRVSRPRANWSEQDPEDWWAAAEAAVLALPAKLRSGVQAIGVSGQMHGATLLGPDDRPLRPCILWNDGRAAAECAELERREPRSREITGNAAMPGFTAPKLLWVRRHEPEIFARTARVLLPKDYVRLCMTGEAASDLSDSAGTLWLDVGARRWSGAMLDACGLSDRQMPALHEGCEATGRLRPAIAAAWGMAAVVVAAGGGDNAAGAVGAGVIEPGQALLSLGTSGVVFVAGERFSPAPERGAHAFCHALPERWHQMAVILSAASAVDWAARLTGFSSVAEAIAAAEALEPFSGEELFLPYLSGERTPHNDADARGVFIGLSLDTDGARLVQAALEGVAFALAEGLDVLLEAGSAVETLNVVGGGSRSSHWARILAGALNRTLTYRQDSHLGPAFGAARLARLAVGGEPLEAVCQAPPVQREQPPEPELVARAAERAARFRRLYPAVRSA